MCCDDTGIYVIVRIRYAAQVAGSKKEAKKNYVDRNFEGGSF
jgi:chorismate mutase